MHPLLSDDNLTRLAGQGAFQRGQRYFNEGRVTVKESGAERLRAGVKGSASYTVELALSGDGLSAYCDCPVDGFCKHAVAAALAWRGEAPVPPQAPKTAAPDLGAFLKGQTAERLARLLAKYADEYDGIHRELTLLARVETSQNDPAALGKAVRGFLNVRRFLDYRGSIDYARELDGLLDLLRGTLEQNPALCADLCEAAAARLFRIYGNADDSAGAIGDRFHELGELHRQACRVSSPPPKELAKRLYALDKEDEWGIFDFTRYRQALGDDGLAAFATLAQKEWDSLPPPQSSMDRYGRRWHLRHLLETWAKEVRDHDYLIALRSSDLTSPGDHVQLVDAYREAGRLREALAAAEQGMKAFPRDWTLREAAARELREAGMDDEALALLWRNFEEQPSEHTYQRLLAAAGDQVETWRGRAMEALRVLEQSRARGGKGDASLRIAILLGEERTAEAVTLATDHGCNLHLLEGLAVVAEKIAPAAAAAFYRRAIEFSMGHNPGNATYATAASHLMRMRPLMPPAEFGAYVADLRQRFRAKRNFIKALDGMGT
jgi:tetratricopeptide (TPR) repeat protein